MSKQRFSAGNLFERAAEREQIARTGGAERDFGEQAFQIENAAELLAQFGAQDGLLQQFADGVEALLRFRRGPCEGRSRRWRSRRPPMPVRV